MESRQIFREKSIERVSSPEQLDDYIKVTTPSVWLILSATIALLAGVCIVFSPGENFEPSGSQKSMLAFARKRMEGTGSAVTFVAVTTSITSISAILSAGFARFFMDAELEKDRAAWRQHGT